MPRRLDVLLVDDDPSERIFIEDALEAGGHAHALDYAESGRAALARLKDRRPDLMILDVRMPGLSGFDVLEAVRGRRELYPMSIFIVSNTMIEADKTRALSMGAQGYRVKPLSPDGYQDLVDDLCRVIGAPR